VTVTDATGASTAGRTIERGTDLRLTIHAEVLEPTEWITGFTLQSSLGHAVYRLNTEGLGIDLPAAPGRYDVQFSIPSTNFGINRLIISAGATDGDGTPIALLDPAGVLDYADDPFGAGVVQFAASGTVTPVTA